MDGVPEVGAGAIGAHYMHMLDYVVTPRPTAVNKRNGLDLEEH